MRLRLAWVLFVLGVLAAGCGGGGKSGIVPAAGSNPGSGNSGAPATAKTTHASISLYIPPANRQASRKPLYISPNTQAFGVFVEPYPSVVPSIGPSTSPPPGLQIIPVATPSPCAVATGGGYTCTLTVTAPVGSDLFIVVAFASASPNPSAGPLSAFVSGPVTVSLSPSPGASPLAFTLNGVVNSVAVAVQSPDPGNTPNTQVFPAAVPTSASLAITAFDSSGNVIMSDATTPYFNPIVIQASPAALGLTLSLIGSSVCGSTASGAAASINCEGDLGNVQVTYDGTPRPDASDHLIDAYSVYSTTAPNPTPSPANFVLASNMLNYPLATALNVSGPGYLLRTTAGKFVYIVNAISGWQIGTFAPSTSTSTAPMQMTTASGIDSAAIAPNGDVWVDDDGPLDCYPQTGGSANPIGLYPVVQGSSPPAGDTIYPTAITIDTAGNLWYAGYDDVSTPQMYAGYFNVSSGCSSVISMPITAQFTLNNDMADYNPTLTPLTGGGVAMGTGTYYGSGLYLMTTGSTSPISIIPAVASPQPISFGVAADGANNVYVGYQLAGGGPPDIEKLISGSSTLNTLLLLPPQPSAPYPQPSPTGGLNVFSPGGGAADRAMYADSNYAALGLVESIASSPMPILVSLPNTAFALATAYNNNGGEYILNTDGSGNLNLTRALPTKTWSVANLSLNTGCGGTLALLTILERGDSGPFTVSIPPANGTSLQFPDADHDFLLVLNSGTSTFQATVTDANGRTQTPTIAAMGSSFNCGARHRPHTRPPHGVH